MYAQRSYGSHVGSENQRSYMSSCKTQKSTNNQTSSQHAAIFDQIHRTGELNINFKLFYAIVILLWGDIQTYYHQNDPTARIRSMPHLEDVIYTPKHVWLTDLALTWIAMAFITRECAVRNPDYSYLYRSP